MADVTQSIDVRIQTAIDASNSAKTLTELKASMRDLNSLALESGDTQSEAYLKAATAAGQARDKIVDLRAQTNALAGSKLEGLSNSISLVGNSITSLDFGQATSGIKGFITILKGFSFAEIGTEIKALATAFGELAVAILANPITWIAVAIVGIIAAFGKLKDIVDFVSVAISKLTDIWNSFTDALGLTHNELEKNSKALQDYNTQLENANKLQIELEKAAGRSGMNLLWQNINLEIKRTNNDLETTLKKLDLSENAISSIKNMWAGTGQVSLEYIKQFKQNIKQEDYDKITKSLGDWSKAYSDMLVFIRSLATENQNLANQVSKNLAELYVMGIHNHRKAELEKEKITYEAIQRDNKVKKDALNKELEDINKQQRVATGIQIDQLKTQEQNVSQKLSVINSETRLAHKTLKENTKKINDKYDIEDRANLLKNLKSDFDLITTNTTLTENQKYLLHEENINKQIVASDAYYDRQIKAEEGDEAKVKQLNKDKEVAHQQLEDQKFKVSTDYYAKANALAADEVNKDAEKDKKILENEKNLNEALINLKLQHLQNIQSIDEMELANLKIKHNKSFSDERNLIRKINADKNAVYNERKLKETSDENIKYQEQLKLAGLNNALKEQLEVQHKIVLADIENKFNANVKQNNIETNEQIKQNKIESVQRQIQMAQYGADAMNSIFDMVSTFDDERVKKGEMSDKDAKKRAFNRQKVSGSLTATINTAMAVTQALGTLPPPYSFIAAGLLGAAGIAQIVKINSQQYSDSASGGSSAVSVPTSPDFGTAPTSNTSSMFNASAFYGVGTQRTDESTGRHREAQRIYVVESDITSTQKRVEVQAQRGTLSGV